MSHPNCKGPEHVCHKPSGRPCLEPGCNKPAGTLWGPMWCPEHDRERLDRIDTQLSDLVASFNRR
jgi:hypothetical protein